MGPGGDREYGKAFTTAVAAELRAQRERLHMTFPALADTTGIPRNTLMRYLNGYRDIPLAAFGRIARALQLDASKLLDAVQADLQKKL